MVFLLSQIDGRVDAPTTDEFYPVGSLARVLQLFRAGEDMHLNRLVVVSRTLFTWKCRPRSAAYWASV